MFGDPLSATQLVETIDDNGRISTRTTDLTTYTETFVSPEGRASTIVRDADGRVVETRPPGLLPTVLSYDGDGRLESIAVGTGQDARVTTYGYGGADGYLETVQTSADLQPATMTTDALGRVTQIERQDATIVGMSYDANGNLSSVMPPGRAAHGMSYSVVNLQSGYEPPSLGVEPTDWHSATAHDRDRRVDLQTDAEQRQIDYVYDPTTGQLVAINGLVSQTVFEHDPATGQLQTVTATDSMGTHSLSYGYDGTLRTRETWGGDTGLTSGVVLLTYTPDFDIETIRVSGLLVANYAYDNDRLLTGSGAMTIQRGADDGLIDGTVIGQLSTSESISGFGELDHYAAAWAGTDFFVEDVSSRDPVGRIVHRDEGIASSGPLATTAYDYDYDELGRLTWVAEGGVQTGAYDYDDNGNRVAHHTALGTVAGQYDAQDRLQQYCPLDVGGAPAPIAGLPCFQYSYNRAGQLVGKTDLANSTTTTFDYDERGALRGANPPGVAIEYEIDASGRRVGKYVDGVKVQGLLYKDGLNPIAELDGNNAIVSSFTYGTRSHVPDLMVRSGLTYRIVTDRLGSVRLVVSVTDGSVAQRIDYDEFGNVLLDSNPGFQPFGFAGGLYDPDTGLVRFGARDYDPVVGRWTAKDPLLFADGTNMYAYVGNDPINSIDPSGLYGTNDCSYYEQRCAESGGDYYCDTAQTWCDRFPSSPDPDPSRDDDFEGWARCTRQCLQDCDRVQNQDQNACPGSPDPDTDGFWDRGAFECHAACYTGCAAWGAGIPPHDAL